MAAPKVKVGPSAASRSEAAIYREQASGAKQWTTAPVHTGAVVPDQGGVAAQLTRDGSGGSLGAVLVWWRRLAEWRSRIRVRMLSDTCL